MNCEAARDRMLEADPAELADRSDTPLGRHLRECPGCRTAAIRIVGDTTWLGNQLAVPPRGSADGALAALRRRRARSPRGLVPWTAAAAAAAALAAVLLAEPWSAPQFTPEPGLALEPERPPPVVEDAGGASLAVFATADPRITVVWIYEENSR